MVAPLCVCVNRWLLNMCPMWATASVRWMSTPPRSWWAEPTPSLCTTPARSVIHTAGILIMQLKLIVTKLINWMHLWWWFVVFRTLCWPVPSSWIWWSWQNCVRESHSALGRIQFSRVSTASCRCSASSSKPLSCHRGRRWSTRSSGSVRASKTSWGEIQFFKSCIVSDSICMKLSISVSFRACLGLPPQNHMQLEHKMEKSFMHSEENHIHHPVLINGKIDHISAYQSAKYIEMNSHEKKQQHTIS